MLNLKIAGTGRALPKRSVTNSELGNIVETSDEWISSRTGIRERRISTEESLTDLCTEAAEKAIHSAGLSASDIDLLLCSTIGGDYLTPSLSCAVLERLGITCPAFDINAACSGFIYALDVADSYLSADKAGNILIISAEMMSRYTDWRDRATCVLFGDGAGACIVTKGSGLKYIKLTATGDTKILNLPSGNGNCPFRQSQEPGYLHMQGQDVFKFAVSTIESLTRDALSRLNLQPEDIDHYILHQANRRIIEAARTRLKLPEEKFPMNIGKYGNMSSATVPVLLDELIEDGRVKKGDRLLMTAFGAGLTAGLCVMDWE